MGHVGKAAELRGDLANASDNLAGRYWIVLMDHCCPNVRKSGSAR
jgi:hypothetical protein